MKKKEPNGKTGRYCDKCECPLTHIRGDLQGKFGNAKRINEGVVTVTWTKHSHGMREYGEWCKECAPGAMAVFMDSLLEKM